MATRTLPFSDLAGLAAAKAALDPGRASWRSDILLSSVIEVLSSLGPMTERELLTQVQRLWVTTAVNRAMLRTTLEQAADANLVEPRQHGKHETRWAATDASAADAGQDRNWAARITADFESAIGQRLIELSEEPIEAGRVPRLTRTLISALIIGSSQVFHGVASAGEAAIHGRIAYDSARAREYIDEKVRPPQLAQLVSALAEAVLDPTDDFGTEIMRLIVQGQVLHGLLSRRDLQDRSLTSNTLLLLDTSVLFYLLTPQNAQFRVLEDFISEAIRAGADVVVTRAVLDEWERVWQAAEGEHSALTGSGTNVPPGLAARLAGNVVIRQWYAADEWGDGPTWDSFRKRHRNVERWLVKHGVRVTAEAPSNSTLVSELCSELERLSDEAPRQKRTHTAAQTDAHSAALVRQWRENHPSPVPLAWFVAQERLTGRAYRAVCQDDDFPLNMPVEEGLLLLSAARIDDPSDRRELAEVVGDSLIMGSFFSLTTGYGPDDLLAMIDLLGLEDGPITNEEAVESLRADYRALARTAADPPAELLRRRAARRDRQARRRLEDAQAQEAQMALQVTQAEDRVRAEEATKASRLQASNKRLRRTLALLLILVLLIVADVAAYVLGAPSLALIGAAIATVIVAAEGFIWVMTEQMKTSVFVATIIATAGWTLVGATIGADDDPTPGKESDPMETPSLSESNHMTRSA